GVFHFRGGFERRQILRIDSKRLVECGESVRLPAGGFTGEALKREQLRIARRFAKRPIGKRQGFERLVGAQGRYDLRRVLRARTSRYRTDQYKGPEHDCKRYSEDIASGVARGAPRGDIYCSRMS